MSENQRILLRPSEAGDRLSYGETKTRDLIRSGRLRVVSVDGAIRVPVAALDEFVAGLPAIGDSC